MACLYKKQSKKGVKIFDCFQHLVLKSFILIRCYLDLKNSIKSKFTIKTISMSSRLILFRDDNFFDIFYSMFHFVIEESRNSKKSMFFMSRFSTKVSPVNFRLFFEILLKMFSVYFFKSLFGCRHIFTWLLNLTILDIHLVLGCSETILVVKLLVKPRQDVYMCCWFFECR